MRDRILNLLKTEESLPPLPDMVIRLHEMVSRLDTNVKDIVRVIELDPVLAWNILKLSNSVFYSRSSQTIRTLPVAITHIGLHALMNLVYALKLSPLFSDSEFISSSSVWIHSLSVGLLSQSLARHEGVPEEEQDIAYLAGLMHDVGILVFAYLIPLEYHAFITSAATVQEPLHRLEANELGIDHAEVGARYIEQWWHVDPRISSAVRRHHREIGMLAENRMELRVNVANALCINEGISNNISTVTDIPSEATLAELGLTPEDQVSIMHDITEMVDQAKSLVYHSMPY